MKLRKMSDGNCILVKLKPGDWKYLTNLSKREGRKFIKQVDRQFKELIAMQIHTISVIKIGEMLLEKGIIKDSDIDKLLEELDDSMIKCQKVVQKYYEKFGNIFDRKTRG
jgi:hypothetical protein